MGKPIFDALLGDMRGLYMERQSPDIASLVRATPILSQACSAIPAWIDRRQSRY